MIELTKGHLEFMNIGSRYWGADLDKLHEEQRKPLEGYIENLKLMVARGVGLFLWGSNGTGKSYIAAALCKYVWSEWRVASYCITAAELKDGWIHGTEAHAGSDETCIQRAERVRFLVIDDLGKEHRTNSGFSEAQFGALLRARARRRLTTTITANLNPKEFETVYGLSSSQLAKECMCPIRLQGDDQRSKLASAIGRAVGS